MFRSLIIGAVSVAVLAMPASASAQQGNKYGTAAEAQAMLRRVVAFVKADKVRALASFSAGASGFKDRDLQPFCFNKSDGKLTVSTHPNLVGTDVRTLKDITGKAFGQENFKAAVDGQITEVRYMFPRPGETEPASKISYLTGVGDQDCGVGYFK